MVTKKIKLLLNELQDKSIVDFTYFANSLALYIDCKNDKHKGYLIWFEPTWNFSNNKNVLLGSRQLQTDNEELFHSFAKELHPILNKKITSIKIDKISNDIKIIIDNKFIIKTFVTDPEDEEIWHIDNNYNSLRIMASPTNIKVEKK